MSRPMTSGVSALSGNVANSHQAIHFVSSAPSKIPYGGFSPVRLQTSQPAVIFRGMASPRYRLLPPAWTFTHFLFGYLGLRPIQTCRTSSQTRPSSGPWLRRRLFCPLASSLTMATSALLRATPGLCSYPQRSRPAEGPHFYLPELADVPPSLLRWLQ